MDGVQGRKDTDIIPDMHHAKTRHCQEPNHHDRSKQDRDPFGALGLEQEQAYDDANGCGHHIGRKAWGNDGHAFYGRQNRHGRRDHRIAKEQRNPHHANRNQPSWPSLQRLLHQGHQ